MVFNLQVVHWWNLQWAASWESITPKITSYEVYQWERNYIPDFNRFTTNFELYKLPIPEFRLYKAHQSGWSTLHWSMLLFLQRECVHVAPSVFKILQGHAHWCPFFADPTNPYNHLHTLPDWLYFIYPNRSHTEPNKIRSPRESHRAKGEYHLLLHQNLFHKSSWNLDLIIFS